MRTVVEKAAAGDAQAELGLKVRTSRFGKYHLPPIVGLLRSPGIGVHVETPKFKRGTTAACRILHVERLPRMRLGLSSFGREVAL